MTTTNYAAGPFVDNEAAGTTLYYPARAWYEFGGADTIGDVIQPVGSLGSGNAKTADTSFSFNTSLAVKAGQLVVLEVTTDNESTSDGDNNEHVSVTIDGNTMLQAGEYTNSEAASNAGVTVSVWYWLATEDVAAAVAVVTTLSAGKTAKAADGWVFDIADGYTVSVDGTQTGGTTAADPESLTATGSDAGFHIWWRAIGAEDNHAGVGALTPTTGWTATVGTGTEGNPSASNISIRGEWKIASGTGSGASNPSISSTPDTASLLVGLLISKTVTEGEMLASMNVPFQRQLRRPVTMISY